MSSLCRWVDHTKSNGSLAGALSAFSRAQPMRRPTIHLVNVWLRERSSAGADGGFTLIELMVVLLILAILLAIAIPTFLGVTKSANDRAAQSNLNTALMNAKAQYQQNSQSYPATAALVTALQSAEPSLSFASGCLRRPEPHLGVLTADGNALVLAAFSKPQELLDRGRHAGGNSSGDRPVRRAAGAGCGCRHDPRNGWCSQRERAFVDNTLGPTYAEMKTVSNGTEDSAHCVASQPVPMPARPTAVHGRPSRASEAI